MRPLALLALLLGCSACTNQILSDDRIRSSTEHALGEPVLAIEGRDSSEITNTYYRARTPSGTYRCMINGGNILTFGMANPVQCSPMPPTRRPVL